MLQLLTFHSIPTLSAPIFFQPRTFIISSPTHIKKKRKKENPFYTAIIVVVAQSGLRVRYLLSFVGFSSLSFSGKSIV